MWNMHSRRGRRRSIRIVSVIIFVQIRSIRLRAVSTLSMLSRLDVVLILALVRSAILALAIAIAGAVVVLAGPQEVGDFRVKRLLLATNISMMLVIRSERTTSTSASSMTSTGTRTIIIIMTMTETETMATRTTTTTVRGIRPSRAR